jgi:hypothetical protein
VGDLVRHKKRGLVQVEVVSLDGKTCWIVWGPGDRDRTEVKVKDLAYVNRPELPGDDQADDAPRPWPTPQPRVRRLTGEELKEAVYEFEERGDLDGEVCGELVAEGHGEQLLCDVVLYGACCWRQASATVQRQVPDPTAGYVLDYIVYRMHRTGKREVVLRADVLGKELGMPYSTQYGALGRLAAAGLSADEARKPAKGRGRVRHVRPDVAGLCRKDWKGLEPLILEAGKGKAPPKPEKLTGPNEDGKLPPDEMTYWGWKLFEDPAWTRANLRKVPWQALVRHLLYHKRNWYRQSKLLPRELPPGEARLYDMFSNHRKTYGVEKEDDVWYLLEEWYATAAKVAQVTGLSREQQNHLLFGRRGSRKAPKGGLVGRKLAKVYGLKTDGGAVRRGVRLDPGRAVEMVRHLHPILGRMG